jgi:hypothetical protein
MVVAFRMQRNAILIASPTVPENVVIRRVGSERARAPALSRVGGSPRTAVVLSGPSSPIEAEVQGSDP